MKLLVVISKSLLLAAVLAFSSPLNGDAAAGSLIWNFNSPQVEPELYQEGWLQNYPSGTPSVFLDFCFSLAHSYLGTCQETGALGTQRIYTRIEDAANPNEFASVDSRSQVGDGSDISQAMGYNQDEDTSSKADLSGLATQYEYDQYGRKITQIDGNGNKVSFSYDAFGHLCSQVNALGERITYAYDGAGNITEENNGVQIIKRSYDGRHRLTKVDYGMPGQQVNYSYGDKGEIAYIATPTTAFGYSYDSEGHLAATRAFSSDGEQLLRFRYDDLGQRTGLLLAKAFAPTDSTGINSSYGTKYDILQQTEWNYHGRQLTGIVSNGQPVINYQYDTAGRPILKIFGDGIQAVLSYDTIGHLVGIRFSGGPLVVPVTLTYEWNKDDQIVHRDWNGFSQHYEYDPDGRLVKVIADDAPNSVLEAYAYDKAGNMTEKILRGYYKSTFAYNAANELTSSYEGGRTLRFAYDRAGRMISPCFAGGPTNTYGWLDKVVRTSVGYGEDTLFTYWPDGQLASQGPAGDSSFLTKVTYGPQKNTEHFLWDGLALLRRGDTIFIAEPHPTGGAIVASHPIGHPDELTYYLNDILGTTLAVIKGNSIQFDNTSSFGEMLSQTTGPLTVDPRQDNKLSQPRD